MSKQTGAALTHNHFEGVVFRRMQGVEFQRLVFKAPTLTAEQAQTVISTKERHCVTTAHLPRWLLASLVILVEVVEVATTTAIASTLDT